MVAATHTMVFGLLFGGPIALIGFFIFFASLHDLPVWHSKKQFMVWGRSPKCVGGLVCLFAGLIIVVLGMIPFISLSF